MERTTLGERESWLVFIKIKQNFFIERVCDFYKNETEYLLKERVSSCYYKKKLNN